MFPKKPKSIYVLHARSAISVFTFVKLIFRLVIRDVLTKIWPDLTGMPEWFIRFNRRFGRVHFSRICFPLIGRYQHGQAFRGRDGNWYVHKHWVQKGFSSLEILQTAQNYYAKSNIKK